MSSTITLAALTVAALAILGGAYMARVARHHMSLTAAPRPVIRTVTGPPAAAVPGPGHAPAPASPARRPRRVVTAVRLLAVFGLTGAAWRAMGYPTSLVAALLLVPFTLALYLTRRWR